GPAARAVLRAGVHLVLVGRVDQVRGAVAAADRVERRTAPAAQRTVVLGAAADPRHVLAGHRDRVELVDRERTGLGPRAGDRTVRRRTVDPAVVADEHPAGHPRVERERVLVGVHAGTAGPGGPRVLRLQQRHARYPHV